MTTNKPEVFEVYRTKQGTLENVVLLADYEALKAAEQHLALDVAHLVGALEHGFPLLSDEGLDEVEHHCEYVIQRERKRVHSILAAHRKEG